MRPAQYTPEHTSDNSNSTDWKRKHRELKKTRTTIKFWNLFAPQSWLRFCFFIRFSFSSRFFPNAHSRNLAWYSNKRAFLRCFAMQSARKIRATRSPHTRAILVRDLYRGIVLLSLDWRLEGFYFYILIFI